MALNLNIGNVHTYKTVYEEMLAAGGTLATAAAAIKTELDAYEAAELAKGSFVTFEQQNIKSEGVMIDGGVVGVQAVDTLPPTIRTF